MASQKWEIPRPDQRAGLGVLDCFEEFLRRNEPDHLRNREYSLNQFAQLCGRAEPDDDTLNCARYLVSQGVFEVFYLFLDSHGEFSETYSAREVEDAEQVGSLVDPHTGNELSDFRTRLFSFFALNEPKHT